MKNKRVLNLRISVGLMAAVGLALAGLTWKIHPLVCAAAVAAVAAACG